MLGGSSFIVSQIGHSKTFSELEVGTPSVFSVSEMLPGWDKKSKRFLYSFPSYTSSSLFSDSCHGRLLSTFHILRSELLRSIVIMLLRLNSGRAWASPIYKYVWSMHACMYVCMIYACMYGELLRLEVKFNHLHIHGELARYAPVNGMPHHPIYGADRGRQQGVCITKRESSPGGWGIVTPTSQVFTVGHTTDRYITFLHADLQTLSRNKVSPRNRKK